MKFKKLVPLFAFVLGATLFLSSCIKGLEDTFAVQLKKDIDAIDAHLNSNSITAIKDVSGLRFTVDASGNGGYTPRITDQVKFDYVCKYLNGTVVESKSITDFTSVSSYITGFQIGLPQIPVGSTVTLYIPSGYAYGTTGKNTIPGNSILVFMVTMKEIKPISTEATQLTTDTTAWNTFFTNNPSITGVVKDTTGLRYVITQAGTGNAPGLYSRVKISYKGYLVSSNQKGVLFSEGISEPSTTTDSRVVTFIRGFQFGLMKMQKGGKATFYIPSVMAFGSNTFNSGSVNVPANSNVIYEVECTDVLAP